MSNRQEELRSYQEIDQTLALAERATSDIFARENESRVQSGSAPLVPIFERYRDSFDSSIRWHGEDGISRSIQAVIDEDSLSTMRVHANAWQDELDLNGKLVVRRWIHAETAIINKASATSDMSFDDLVARGVASGYGVASSWTEDQLVNIEAY